MGASGHAQVDRLVEESITLLSECDPGRQDPLFGDAWSTLIDLTQAGGTRLLEKRFGYLMGAADEVCLYLGQLERVSRVSHGAPFRVPQMAIRPLQAAGRFVEDTHDLDEVCALLLVTPQIAAAYSDYLRRTAGRQARPVLDLLELAVRAGSVYRDSFRRAVPAGDLD